MVTDLTDLCVVPWWCFQAGMKNDDLLNKPPEEKRPSAYDEVS